MGPQSKPLRFGRFERPLLLIINMTPKLPPRYNKKTVITAPDLNLILDAIEWIANLRVDVTSGLEYSEDSVGRTIRLSRQAEDPTAIMVLSTQLDAGDGKTNWGYGKGKIADFTPGSGGSAGSSNVPSDATDEDVYNLLNVPFKSGSTILVGRGPGGVWLYLLTICDNVVGS